MINKAFLITMMLVLPAMAAAQSSEPRLETGVFVTFARLERIGSDDHRPGTGTGGVGGRIGWRVVRGIDIDGELSVHPRAGVSGYRVQGLVGTKVGTWLRRFGVHGKLRPGFLYFERDPFGAAGSGTTVLPAGLRVGRFAHSIEPAVDLGAVVQYAAPQGVLVRFDLGTTLIRYRSRTVFSSPVLPPTRQGGFSTRNRQWSIGLAKRF